MKAGPLVAVAGSVLVAGAVVLMSGGCFEAPAVATAGNIQEAHVVRSDSVDEHLSLPAQSGLLHEPYVEWAIRWDECPGNPFDVVARAIFVHKSSGRQMTSLMFYDGDFTWRFRFTGTELGLWRVMTDGPGTLGGHTSGVTIEPNAAARNGFLMTDGRRWMWPATGQEYVPNMAMADRLGAFWSDGQVDTRAIDAAIREFIVESGFTGFHQAPVANRWFDVESASTDTREIGPDANPDRRAFMVLDELLVRTYRAGAGTHIWVWGSDAYRRKPPWTSERGGPDGIGGPQSPADQRLNHYIAARLGPIPGWSMGYGYDCEQWADKTQLQQWYDFLKGHLHEWNHAIGVRLGTKDIHYVIDNKAGTVRRVPIKMGDEGIYWSGGDYVGLYDYRVPYLWYRESAEFSRKHNVTVLQEDRFRIRQMPRFQIKDYTSELTRRGLWHSMMAGGVGSIWGNLAAPSPGGGSRPYDSRDAGRVQGVAFTVDIKPAIAAWRDFWFAGKRWRSDYEYADGLTDYQSGPKIWDSSPGGGYISVALKSPANRHFIFYVEQRQHVRMDLRGMDGHQPAVALNTVTGEWLSLPNLEPQLYEQLDLGSRSAWAVAVGRFD